MIVAIAALALLAAYGAGLAAWVRTASRPTAALPLGRDLSAWLGHVSVVILSATLLLVIASYGLDALVRTGLIASGPLLNFVEGWAFPLVDVVAKRGAPGRWQDFSPPLGVLYGFILATSAAFLSWLALGVGRWTPRNPFDPEAVRARQFLQAPAAIAGTLAPLASHWAFDARSRAWFVPTMGCATAAVLLTAPLLGGQGGVVFPGFMWASGAAVTATLWLLMACGTNERQVAEPALRAPGPPTREPVITAEEWVRRMADEGVIVEEVESPPTYEPAAAALVWPPFSSALLCDIADAVMGRTAMTIEHRDLLGELCCVSIPSQAGEHAAPIRLTHLESDRPVYCLATPRGTLKTEAAFTAAAYFARALGARTAFIYPSQSVSKYQARRFTAATQGRFPVKAWDVTEGAQVPADALAMFVDLEGWLSLAPMDQAIDRLRLVVVEDADQLSLLALSALQFSLRDLARRLDDDRLALDLLLSVASTPGAAAQLTRFSEHLAGRLGRVRVGRPERRLPLRVYRIQRIERQPAIRVGRAISAPLTGCLASLQCETPTWLGHFGDLTEAERSAVLGAGRERHAAYEPATELARVSVVEFTSATLLMGAEQLDRAGSHLDAAAAPDRIALVLAGPGAVERLAVGHLESFLGRLVALHHHTRRLIVPVGALRHVSRYAEMMTANGPIPETDLLASLRNPEDMRRASHGLIAARRISRLKRRRLDRTSIPPRPVEQFVVQAAANHGTSDGGSGTETSATNDCVSLMFEGSALASIDRLRLPIVAYYRAVLSLMGLRLKVAGYEENGVRLEAEDKDIRTIRRGVRTFTHSANEWARLTRAKTLSHGASLWFAEVPGQYSEEVKEIAEEERVGLLVTTQVLELSGAIPGEARKTTFATAALVLGVGTGLAQGAARVLAAGFDALLPVFTNARPTDVAAVPVLCNAFPSIDGTRTDDGKWAIALVDLYPGSLRFLDQFDEDLLHGIILETLTLCRFGHAELASAGFFSGYLEAVVAADVAGLVAALDGWMPVPASEAESDER